MKKDKIMVQQKLESKSERGVSVVELVLVVIAVAILALLVASLPQAIASIRKSGNTSLARGIAEKELDLLRRQQYINLVNGSNNFTDTNLFKLPLPVAIYEVDDCPPSICALGESAKEVKVSVSWVEAGTTKSVELLTIISQGGLGQ